MKLLTANFICCAVKSCKTSPASFPLHFRDAVLEQADLPFNPLFLTNMLPRLEWSALRSAAIELGISTLPEEKPEIPHLAAPISTKQDPDSTEDSEVDADEDTTMTIQPTLHTAEHEQMLRELHRILIETQVMEGKMVCGNCGWEYRIKEGIANFLLPSHLV